MRAVFQEKELELELGITEYIPLSVQQPIQSHVGISS